jgi:putative ABC transport system permease protein
VGGVLGSLLALFAFHGQTTAFTNFRSFTEIQYRLEVTPRVAGEAFLVAGVMGVLGGLLPALRAARRAIVQALREM